MTKSPAPRPSGPGSPAPGGAGSPLPRFPRWLLFALLAATVFQAVLAWNQSRQANHVSYSELRDAIASGRFSEVVISEDAVRGVVGTAEEAADSEASDAAPAPDEAEPEGDWVATRVPNDEGLVTLLEDHDVDYRYAQSSDALLWIFWIVGGFLLLSLLMRRAASRAGGMGPQGMLGIGKSKARVHVEPDTGVTFEDVAGIEEAVDELEEIVSFLAQPERYERIGARIPKGVLLVGPPGTGKTLLARAVAGHAGVPFFSLSGSEFMEMFVGVGAARVRDLFKQATERQPAIVFIDELDALAKSRGGAQAMGGHDEREQTLNQLLSEMDGFDPRQRVIVLAATNRPEVIDPALLRPGRFDRQVLVDKPSRAGRRAILAIHAEKVQLEDEADLDEVAARSSGMAGADLANIVNEAALLAVRRGAKRVARQDFEEAMDRIMAGLRRKGFRLNDDDKRRVACHEAGHAIASLLAEEADPVHKVSIVSRGPGALGYTLQLPEEDRALMGEQGLRDRLAVLLGGRAAEAMMLGSLSTGASDDLRKATELARAMVAEYGMSPELGPVYLRQPRMPAVGGLGEAPRGAGEVSEETAQRIDQEVTRLLQEGSARAEGWLTEHRRLHAALVQRLLEEEVIGSEALEEMLTEHGVKATNRPHAA